MLILYLHPPLSAWMLVTKQVVERTRFSWFPSSFLKIIKKKQVEATKRQSKIDVRCKVTLRGQPITGK